MHLCSRPSFGAVWLAYNVELDNMTSTIIMTGGNRGKGKENMMTV